MSSLLTLKNNYMRSKASAHSVTVRQLSQEGRATPKTNLAHGIELGTEAKAKTCLSF